MKKEEVKKPAAAKAEAAKPVAEKPAVKKPAARKPAKKAADPKSTVYVEYGEKQLATKDILKLAQKAYKKKHRGAVIKTLEVYIKPEENAAYYVVNGEGSADFVVYL